MSMFSINNPRKALIIEEALSCLTSEEKDAFILKHAHCYTYIEVSVALGYPHDSEYARTILDRVDLKLKNQDDNIPFVIDEYRCKWCGKSACKRLINRWHNDNCKFRKYHDETFNDDQIEPVDNTSLFNSELYKHFDILSDEDRLLITLEFNLDNNIKMSRRKIAKILGCSAPSIRWRLERIMKKLKEQL